ncbi:MAG TPA: 2-amino-4-hydroxy-6-hydroxymethyldihydropteridine diphosphokinase [Gemmatimonadaceae bacterium]|nr:2-amino-4-hydroxy-6-hydroxymethyldihydropteridine diphosphokinase [Gemmatimonadaceae bacterium]
MPVRSGAVNTRSAATGAALDAMRMERAGPCATRPAIGDAGGVRDIAYIALGSNVGDRQAHLANARAALAALPESRLLAQSSVDETEPLGPVSQPPFLNQMVALETALAPRRLLAALHAIERAEGRVRRVRWGPRELDLDIVCFERQMVSEPDLVVPHPELPNRSFWQRELLELRGAR